MFRGLLWLFNFLHKEWGRAGGKRGSCNSAYSLNFQHLELLGDTLGFVVMRLSSLFAVPHTRSPLGSQSFRRSPCDLCERADIAAARWGITPFFFFFFCNTTGGLAYKRLGLVLSYWIPTKVHITWSTWLSTVFVHGPIFIRGCVQSHCRGSCMKRYQEATIFFLQVTPVNLWGRGCEIKNSSASSELVVLV